MFANDFNECWPIPPHAQERFSGLSEIGTHRSNGDAAHADPSVGQAFWIIIKSGGTTNKQFICPNSSDAADTTANPMTYFDFEGPRALSYGYLYPYGQSQAKPSENLAPAMPMAADKCFTSAGEDIRSQGHCDFKQWQPERWQPYNATHHKGEGQNVLYQDGHASFEKTPACGLKAAEFPRDTCYEHRDLIYDNADGTFGGAPGGWPLDANDSVIVHSPR